MAFLVFSILRTRVDAIEDGIKVAKSKCWDPEDSTTKVSCNADNTACGECINHLSIGCQNNSSGVGVTTKCVNGEYQEMTCERGLECQEDGRSCKLCKHSAYVKMNEMMCRAGSNVDILVCTENGSWVLKTCKPDPYGDDKDNHCRTDGVEYHDWCPGGY